MSDCLICSASVDPFHRFGRMPIANGFLQPSEFDDEFFFNLEIGFCTNCQMVQLTELVEPDQLFHADYAYFSSISARMAEHFQQYSQWVRANQLDDSDPLVVEVGSNDGIMLRHFADAGIRHVGVEPSANVAKAAEQRGVHTICRFFGEETAQQIRDEHGPADVVLGANVICHIPDLHAIFRGLDILLKETGVFVFEEPYLRDIVEKTSYDQIYDEHVFYFSLHSVSSLARRHGMEVIDVLPQTVHGGSMRYVIARQGKRDTAATIASTLTQEATAGLASAATFNELSRRIDTSRDRLLELLRELKQHGSRICGYGATSKSTTVTNFCAIGPDLIDFISDTTPGKQGRFSPGVHIPIVPPERFTDSSPDYALLFAWNHAVEILANEQAFRDSGGRFIVYVPKVGILDKNAIAGESESFVRRAG
jgi:methylation protein EvaC